MTLGSQALRSSPCDQHLFIALYADSLQQKTSAVGNVSWCHQLSFARTFISSLAFQNGNTGVRFHSKCFPYLSSDMILLHQVVSRVFCILAAACPRLSLRVLRTHCILAQSLISVVVDKLSTVQYACRSQARRSFQPETLNPARRCPCPTSTRQTSQPTSRIVTRSNIQ